jgi:hypothetical protein
LAQVQLSSFTVDSMPVEFSFSAGLNRVVWIRKMIKPAARLLG